ncbi:MAG: dCTP deaminase [Chloroflexi bacterium]|nr:dCTP deaminase [Chloroflexota bacterium]
MGLKPDHWIRKMAREHGMIEPFADSQVRNGVISYGVSSYGYDIRVADEFKIFTNVYSAVVDPKHFDPRSMVDFQGEVCVIPPNSFALARTIEYFRIPRGVLTICLGKSTYARCFVGNTRVALVDGSSPTLEEMARRSDDGELFWGYSVGPFGCIIVTLLDQPRFIGRDQVVEITLDNGEKILCTPDHDFLTRDGRMVNAADLRPGAALMPLYRRHARGYELVYQPLDGHLYPTHRLADEWNLRSGIYLDTLGTHRHHIDVSRRNNNPWNLTRMEAAEHIRLHNRDSYGEEFDPDAHSLAIREAMASRAKHPEWRENFSRVQRERALNFWRGDAYAPIRERVLAMRQNPSDETPQLHRQAMLERFSDPEERLRQSELMKRVWAGDSGERRSRQADNHKVAAIRSLPGDQDVYCLTVPEAGNFALESGVFVSNCGIITNVTPFEPEWEGFVTLEISNTTPLPARIYSNEGIAQVLFFEGDEVCETSYADKKGKYQKQQTIVLPKL